jgi:hypothetical protein
MDEGTPGSGTLPYPTVTGYGATHTVFWASWRACADCGQIGASTNVIQTQGIISGGPFDEHGYSFIDWQLPSNLASLEPGTYDASASTFQWSSLPHVAGADPSIHLPITLVTSGHTIVSVPTPSLIALLPRRIDLSPVLRRVNPVLQDVSAIGATAVLRALGRPAQRRAVREGPWSAYNAYIDLPAFSRKAP